MLGEGVVLSEARDVLEGIVDSDRADIPAVVQRSQLAQQDRPPPRPQPRCQIPDWFHDLRADAADNYRDARQALDDSMTQRARLVEVVEVAARRSPTPTPCVRPLMLHSMPLTKG